MIRCVLIVLCCTGGALSFTCEKDGLFADPDDDGKYYKCSGGTATEQVCPDGQSFDGSNCSDLKVAASSSSEGAKVVCYYPNWVGDWCPPEKLDPTLCTHINYAFASLDPKTKTIKAGDPSVDLDQGYYKKVLKLKDKNPNLKVLISLGGWSDSAGSKYSEVAATSQSRKNFAKDATKFVDKYGFDGLDLDWEYPRCPQGECEKDSKDKANYPKLLKELRTEFDKHNPPLLLTAAVSSATYYVDESYDVSAVASVLDFINVMAYDYSQSTDDTTGLNAPLKGKESVVSSMQYWEDKGAPANKLVLGVPFYGVSFTLKDSAKHGLGAPAKGPGKAGKVTNTPGELVYPEICKNVKNGWTKSGDLNSGHYAYSKDQWVGYDDPAMIEEKAKLVLRRGYAGMMMWDVSMDDFKGECCGVKFPLLSVINKKLRGKGKSASSMTCQ